MARLVRHWTAKDIYGKELTLREVVSTIESLDSVSVILFSSFCSVLLGFWKRSWLNYSIYKTLVERLFTSSISNRIMAGWGDRYIFFADVSF